jgi:hypothetical protein
MSDGFYKNDEGLLYAPNSVSGPGFDLAKEAKDGYTYPVEDWYWFDSEAEAREFFGLPPIPEEEQDSWPANTSPSE